MTNIISEIIGHRLSHVEHIHDYYQLYFANGIILSIFNPLQFLGGNTVDFSQKNVIDVKEGKDFLEIIFISDLKMKVDLKNYNPDIPESLSLFRPGKSEVVWQNGPIS